MLENPILEFATYVGDTAEHIRGRPKLVTLRERNLEALVRAYDNTPLQKRDILKYLGLVQLHLSKSSFERFDQSTNHSEAATSSFAADTPAVAARHDEDQFYGSHAASYRYAIGLSKSPEI